MATVPVPRTWTVGELLTAAKMNVDVRDSLNFLLAPPLAVLTKTGIQSVTSGTLTAVTWPTEQVDRDGGHSTSTNTSRYTAATAGYYTFHHWNEWGLASTSGYRRVLFRLNGSTYTHQDGRTSPTTAAVSHLSGMVFMSVGDYAEVIVDQNSGVSLDLSSNARWDVAWTST
ncbi:hypothetical protein ACNF49_14175 [Actinomadura sp. ATCC 39365]